MHMAVWNETVPWGKALMQTKHQQRAAHSKTTFPRSQSWRTSAAWSDYIKEAYALLFSSDILSISFYIKKVLGTPLSVQCREIMAK